MLHMLKRRRRAGAGSSTAAGLLLRPSPDVLVAHRDGVAVLLDLRRETYLGLDEIGTAIWQGVEEGLSADEISGRIAEEYDAPRDVVAADTARFLDDLGARRLVRAVRT